MKHLVFYGKWKWNKNSKDKWMNQTIKIISNLYKTCSLYLIYFSDIIVAENNTFQWNTQGITS